MAIKLTAADFTARTGITEGSIVQWKESLSDRTAAVTLLHDTGIELLWRAEEAESLVQYDLEEAFHNFALIPAAQKYDWKLLMKSAPIDTPEAARSFVMGMLAYQTASDSKSVGQTVVRCALSIETREEAELLFRDLYNLSHRYTKLD